MLRSVLSRSTRVRPPRALFAASLRAAPLCTNTATEAAARDAEAISSLRKHYRLADSDDPTVILAGDIASRAEWDEFNAYRARMSWSQYLVTQQIMGMLAVRHSFVHGRIRQALTVMAVYAAGAEFLHDFFHHDHTIHYVLSLVGTEHAVGFIALSHLSEHFKEYLEEQDKPLHHVSERHRLDLLRIFAGSASPAWPRHIQWYHGKWAASRGDLGCLLSASAIAELRAVEAKGHGGGGGH